MSHSEWILTSYRVPTPFCSCDVDDRAPVLDSSRGPGDVGLPDRFSRSKPNVRMKAL